MNSLKICIDLFSTLNENKIRYCHWKSNVHLEKALSGKTDLDLLIHPDHREKFIDIIEKYDFKKIISPKRKRYPGVEDYMGFDHNTAALVHLHVHYRLITGIKHIKNYDLQYENTLLDNTIFLRTVKVPCPESELFIFIIRSLLKFDYKDLAVNILKKNPVLFPSAVIKEYQFLLSGFNEKRFIKILSAGQTNISALKLISFIEKIQQGRLPLIDLLKTRTYIIRKIKSYRMSKGPAAFYKTIYSYLRNFYIIKKVFPEKKKTLKNGEGRIFALVGADGSGKSTLQNDLIKWLSWKLSVHDVYFGIPKAGLIRSISFAYRYASLAEKITKSKFGTSFFSDLIDSLRWLYIARRRVILFSFCKTAKAHGMVVIADRYPMKHFNTMDTPMDGPRLGSEKKKLLRLVSAMEKKYYDKITFPDQIFILKTDISELRKRKDDLPEEIQIKKADAINSINGNEKISIIDGNKKYDGVLYAVKKKIWEML